MQLQRQRLALVIRHLQPSNRIIDTKRGCWPAVLGGYSLLALQPFSHFLAAN